MSIDGNKPHFRAATKRLRVRSKRERRAAREGNVAKTVEFIPVYLSNNLVENQITERGCFHLSKAEWKELQ